MADAREVLEMMREVARSRISMLRDGITFYDNDRRDHFLREYEEKLKQIDRLIRRLSIRLVGERTGEEREDDSPE